MSQAATPLKHSDRHETEQRVRAVEHIRRCLGDVATILADPAVTDVNLNPDGVLWITRLGGEAAPDGQMRTSQAEGLIAAVALTMGQVATRLSPIVEGKLITDGSRFEGLLPPLVSAPCFSIRRPASAVIPLADYVARGLMTAAQRDCIEAAIAGRQNILVVGGTGAGKTTLLNGVLDSITRLAPDHRILGIEDTAELRCAVPNALFLLTSAEVSATRALKVAMRCFPDRIIVGEVRGAEALDMLMAWNTGHDGGACSLHCNIASPRAALTRLESLVGLASSQPQCRLIGEAVGLIVCVERVRAVRRVSQIVSIHGWDGTDYQLKVEH